MHPASAVWNAKRLVQTLTRRIQTHHLAGVMTKGPARFQAAVNQQQPVAVLQGIGGISAAGGIVKQVNGSRPCLGRPSLRFGRIEAVQRQPLMPEHSCPLHGKAAGCVDSSAILWIANQLGRMNQVQTTVRDEQQGVLLRPLLISGNPLRF